MSAKKGTVDESEIRHFARDSEHWWDENGPFKPLHKLNPVRMAYIKSQICDHFAKGSQNLKPLKDLHILDIGCGGGLVCEPLARMGAQVIGIDADAKAINIARTHAETANLTIDYQCGDASGLSQKFDVVLALEIIEHVSDVKNFMNLCAERLKPEGMLILSTINRTAKSYALGIVAAEYILRWVPQGTHQWKKFLKPSEIAAQARPLGLGVHNVKGLIFNPLKNEFSLSENDLDMNYLITLKWRL